MIFWPMLKLEIHYIVIYYLDEFLFLSFRGFFEDYIIFYTVKCLSFYNSSFALRYFLM